MAMMILSGKRRSLDHPFHEHALTRRELSDHCNVECRLCKHDEARGAGAMYCCEDCGFALHEACAQVELPRRIPEQPSHANHPLNLMCDERSYCCSDCGFNLGALTAIATRLPSQEENTIRHFRHEEHPLSSFCAETKLEVQCGLCAQKISAGQVYGCRSCLFLLHEPCARLAPEIRHPLHRRHPLTFLESSPYKCKVCVWPIKSEPAYCCKKCKFALHVRCAVLSNGARDGQEKDSAAASSVIVKRPPHKHPLTPLYVIELIQSRMECGVCRLNISGAEALGCGDCSFFLHRSCAEKLPGEIQHYLHPQHARLVLQPKEPFVCDCCQGHGSHIAFSCGDCTFNLDPVCALQTLSAIEGGAVASFTYHAHQHPLVLAFTNSAWPYDRLPRKMCPGAFYDSRFCRACEKRIEGVAYRCIDCEGLWFHRSCIELPQELEHELHPEHPLTFLKVPSTSFYCFACREGHFQSAYYCGECQFYIGMSCVSMDQKLKHPCHEHFLDYCKENETDERFQPCHLCGKSSRYDYYFCMRCKFSLHQDCRTLPTSIKHKSHWHPLQLRDKYVHGDPSDQYCDYCETIRNPDRGVYHCAECEYSTHIECVISDHKEGAEESEKWGSDRDNQLNIEIASLKAKLEIMRRDVKTLGTNLTMSEEELALIENKRALYDGEEDSGEESDGDDEEDDDDDLVRFVGDAPRNDRVRVPIMRYRPEHDHDDEENENDEEERQHLKHSCHEHLLILRQLSSEAEAECMICELRIDGSTYCCEDCDYFLHDACALIELPPEIRHPSHPPHPLTLFEEAYECSQCSESRIHAWTAIATLPPPPRDDEEGVIEDAGNEEGVIWHSAHKEHPLAPFQVSLQLPAECRGCRKRISGQVYGCRTCVFLLHASCAQAPRVIDHHSFGTGLTLEEYDPDNDKSRDDSIMEGNSIEEADANKCRVCERKIEHGFVYNRPDALGGLFRLHMACALSTRTPPGHRLEYFTNSKVHPCPLVHLHIEEGATYSPIRCRVCELGISGEACGCPNCWFFLHKSCTNKLPEVIQHYLHSDHDNLVLEARTSAKSTYVDYRCHCANCQLSDFNLYPNPQMAFKCDSCEFLLNPNCALQTLSAVKEGAVAGSFVHFAHDHPLTLHLMRDSNFYCTACKKGINGLGYHCLELDSCHEFVLHKSCAELPQELEHPFHPQHVLELITNRQLYYFYCSACHLQAEGFPYYCAECDFYLDMSCASLNLTLKHHRHQHKLAYFKQVENKSARCNACRKRGKWDFYQCVPCNFSLHHACRSLPPEVKHDGHVHPLFLWDKFVDGDPNYQYCDFCEEIRHPDHGVYRCMECWFFADIDCAISKDKVKAWEETTDIEEANESEAEANEKPSGISESARMKSVIDGCKRNIDRMQGHIQASMKELEELEMEKKTLLSPEM